MQFEKAVRKNVKALIMLAGESGGGKTYSAILLARGLVGPKGRIALVDTEAGRGAYYAGLAGGYDHAEMAPPFTPQRYLEAVEQAENDSYDCLIIDSMSHEWEGEGGVIEQAEAAENRTGKSGLHCWNKPKAAHKKLVNRLLRAKIHIIFCARAREKTIQVKNKGRTEIISGGVQAIVEKNFPFEMLVSAIMLVDGQVPDLRKCPEALLPAFPEGQRISEKTGEIIAAWCSGGAARDQDYEAMAEAGKDAARGGEQALRKWWTGLSAQHKTDMAGLKDSDLKSIASSADIMARDETSADAGPVPVADDPMKKTGEQIMDELLKVLNAAPHVAGFDASMESAVQDGRIAEIEAAGEEVTERFNTACDTARDDILAKDNEGKQA